MSESQYWRFTVREDEAKRLQRAVSDLWPSPEDFWATCRPHYWGQTIERATTFAVGSPAFKNLIETRLHNAGLRQGQHFEVDPYP